MLCVYVYHFFNIVFSSMNQVTSLKVLSLRNVFPHYSSLPTGYINRLFLYTINVVTHVTFVVMCVDDIYLFEYLRVCLLWLLCVYTVQPIHWIYNEEAMKKAVAKCPDAPEFLPVSANPFYTLPTGSQSVYGDQLMVMLQSLVECSGECLYFVKSTPSVGVAISLS